MYLNAPCDLCVLALSSSSLKVNISSRRSESSVTVSMRSITLLLFLSLSHSAAGRETAKVEDNATQLSLQPDVWREVRELRDLVVEQRAELNVLKSRLTSSESELQELREELQAIRTKTGAAGNKANYYNKQGSSSGDYEYLVNLVMGVMGETSCSGKNGQKSSGEHESVQ